MNVFCLNKAFGKEVILREGVCCEIKTTQIALRILFGFAALATLPLTLVGIVLIVLSKSHKKSIRKLWPL
ncbi:MAG: hypothetical protein HWD61_00975 [Parachlamydiaceae bacterium]|nr:MAG: hypothetical protein HWD61_00975 [Parachlamydiaceae bacterium]